MRAGLALLGHVDEKFVEVTDIMEPLESGARDKCVIRTDMFLSGQAYVASAVVHSLASLACRCFISSGYDATSHFETTVEDVVSMYTRITGKVLDLSKENPARASSSAE